MMVRCANFKISRQGRILFCFKYFRMLIFMLLLHIFRNVLCVYIVLLAQFMQVSFRLSVQHIRNIKYKTQEMIVCVRLVYYVWRVLECFYSLLKMEIRHGDRIYLRNSIQSRSRVLDL